MRNMFLPFLALCLFSAADFAAPAFAAVPVVSPSELSAEKIAAPQAQIVSSVESGYVSTNGTQFFLDGQPFFFQGSNFYRLGLIDRQADNEVYDIMRQYHERGIRVVRIWGFSCGDQSKQAMLKSVNKDGATYDEVALRRLDLAIDAARTYGIKVILPLVNYQAEYCPMSWWVKQVTGDGDFHQFYSDPFVRKAFKHHIATLLRRENTIYQAHRGEHRSYSDDPTIMAIELTNELHTEDDYELNHGGTPGDLVYHWLAEMSQHVRSLDRNHLISSGEEGYKANPSTQEETSKHSWLSNGRKGIDFSRNLSLPTIDFATINPYPGNWGIPSSDIDWFLTNFIADRANVAHGLGKPIILEETGFSFHENPHLGYIENPAKYMALIYKAANKAGYAGTMAWEVVPPGSEIGDYVFDFNSPIALSIFQQVGYMSKLTP